MSKSGHHGVDHGMEMEQPFYVRKKPDPIPFSKFLFNSDNGTVLGRTGLSWGKIIQNSNENSWLFRWISKSWEIMKIFIGFALNFSYQIRQKKT